MHFTDGAERDYDTILWATGFRPTLPFLDESLVERRDGVPLQYAGDIVPARLENLGRPTQVAGPGRMPSHSGCFEEDATARV